MNSSLQSHEQVIKEYSKNEKLVFKEIYFHLDVSGTEKVSGLIQESPITKPFIKTRQITITGSVSAVMHMASIRNLFHEFLLVLCCALHIHFEVPVQNPLRIRLVRSLISSITLKFLSSCRS